MYEDVNSLVEKLKMTQNGLTKEKLYENFALMNQTFTDIETFHNQNLKTLKLNNRIYDLQQKQVQVSQYNQK